MLLEDLGKDCLHNTKNTSYKGKIDKLVCLKSITSFYIKRQYEDNKKQTASGEQYGPDMCPTKYVCTRMYLLKELQEFNGIREKPQ